MNDTTNSNLEFRKIPSLNYLYEVNSNGTIFRNVKSKKQSKIKLDMHHSKKGYYAVWVHLGGRGPNSIIKRVMIAHVVAECWLGPKPAGMEVDHIDRNSHNNDYRNLRYVTKSEQMKNRDHSGIAARGTANLLEACAERSKPVALTKDNVRTVYPSQAAAGRFLAEQTGYTVGKACYRLSAGRSHIWGYDIEYLNAETVHNGSTEQETVH